MGIQWRNLYRLFKIILCFRIVIPTEKPEIWKSFVCYVHILFVYVLTPYDRKTRKIAVYKQSKLFRLHCSSSGDIIDIRHIFTVFYPFHKINSSRHNNIMAFEIRYYTLLIHNKDDIQFVIEFPCFLGHPVPYIAGLSL